MLANRTVTLVVTGGIAAYKALELVRLLRKAGVRVIPVMTRAAEKFVTPLTLAALAEEEVHRDLFDLTREARMGHIALARAADLVAVVPASADFLAKMAHGLADDLARVEQQGAVTYETVIAKESAASFLGRATKAADDTITASKIGTQPLHRANVQLSTETSYVRDFVLRHRQGAPLAEPVVDKVWDGVRTEVCATFLPGDRIGLSCELYVQKLHRPIATIEATLAQGLPPVEIQVPRTTHVRLAGVAELSAGDLLVLASRSALEKGEPRLPFKVHQFISQGRAVYATLEPPERRQFSAEGQVVAERPLYPLRFCRICQPLQHFLKRFATLKIQTAFTKTNA